MWTWEVAGAAERKVLKGKLKFEKTKVAKFLILPQCSTDGPLIISIKSLLCNFKFPTVKRNSFA